jgi:hypothetical protein
MNGYGNVLCASFSNFILHPTRNVAEDLRTYVAVSCQWILLKAMYLNNHNVRKLGLAFLLSGSSLDIGSLPNNHITAELMGNIGQNSLEETQTQFPYKTRFRTTA